MPKKWRHISASQMKTHSMCKRKWWIERFSGLPRTPSTPAQQLGTDVHDILERRVKYGLDFPDSKAGRIAQTADKFLTGLKGPIAEGKITLDSINPPLLGFVDLYVPGEVPEIIDYKTCSNWKWAKTSEDLETDLQMIPYAMHAIEKTGADKVRVTHIQMITKGPPEAREASVLLDAEKVKEEWAGLNELAAEMRGTAQIAKAQDVDGNLNACGAYGGCPYKEMCGVAEQMKRPFSDMGLVAPEGKKMGNGENRLQELLRKRREVTGASVGNGAGPSIVPPEAKATAPQPTPEPVETRTETTKLRKAVVDPNSSTETPTQRKERLLSKFSDEDFYAAGEALVGAMKTIGREDVTRKEAGKAVGSALGIKLVRWMYIEQACIMHPDLDCEETKGCWWIGEEDLTTPVDKAVAAADKAGESAERAQDAVDRAVASEAEPEMAVESEEEERGDLFLYIDCWPMKGVEVVPLDHILAPYIKAVADRSGVPTPALLDFGKGKAEVAGWLCLNIPEGHVVASSKSGYWSAVEPYLVGAAKQVVRRFM